MPLNFAVINDPIAHRKISLWALTDHTQKSNYGENFEEGLWTEKEV